MDEIYLNSQQTEDAFRDKLIASFDNLEPRSFSDLTVQCAGGVRIRVHKLIVAGQSAWFEKACTGGFKESNANEVTVQDNADETRAMLSYCYSLDYEADSEIELADLCYFHAKMFAMAEYYQVRGLAKAAQRKFQCSATEMAVDGRVTELAAIIRNAYENTTDPKKLMRDGIVKLVLDNKEELLQGSDTSFTKLIEECHQFAADMTLALVAAPSTAEAQEKRYACPDCEQSFAAEISDVGDYYLCKICDFGMPGRDWSTYQYYMR